MAYARVQPGSPASAQPIDARIYGCFVEHVGRQIYGGIYEPDHALADEDGFRSDVMEHVRGLGVTHIRYPGGNFVSGYRWEDGLGSRDHRPRRLDLAWHSTETNEIGLHEFAKWAEKVGSPLMLAVNLGTRGTEEALELLEYANGAVQTTLTDLRAANGHPQPFDVRMWCLGNEMDGPWQIGHRDAEEYGKLAATTASAMKSLDSSIQLVVCGSSGHGMPTFGSWEREVLVRTFDDVDYISCHSYYQERQGNTQDFLASAEDMAHYIEDVSAIIDAVAACRKSDKKIHISFDEWNVWRLHPPAGQRAAPTGSTNWPVAPRLLEESYRSVDAVVFADLLITLLQHSDRVKSASLSQLVNAVAPIMTEPMRESWLQPTYHPFAKTSQLGRGHALPVEVLSNATIPSRYGALSALNAVATYDETGFTFFMVNRSLNEDLDITIDPAWLLNGSIVTLEEAWLLHHPDISATNSIDNPRCVEPTQLDHSLSHSGEVILQLPAVSWAAIRFRRPFVHPEA